MIISFVTESIEIFQFQENCIRSVIDCFEEADIRVLVTNAKVSNISTVNSRLLKRIDSRFTAFKEDALEIRNLNNEELKLKVIYDKDSIENSDWVILLSPEIEYNDFVNICNKGVLRLKYDFNYYCLQALKNNIHTEITLEKYETITKLWKEYFIEIKTEKGILNNLQKSLSHNSILLLKSFAKSKGIQVYKENGSVTNLRWYAILFYYLRLLKFLFVRKVSLKKKNWKIAIKVGSGEFQCINQPKGSFWADPFVILEKGRFFVFFEELIRETNLGQISVVEIEGFNILKKRVVLNKDYHLSFPNVFKFNEDYFMMPESSQGNHLSIYRAEHFPYKWKRYKTLFNNVKLLDAIWIYHSGFYWLFANRIESFEYDNNERLYLYYSDNLLSDNWISHPQNPIVVDASRARNAGNIFTKGGSLFRPSQNCFESYGSRVNINLIKKLNVYEYEEECVEIMSLPNGYVGMHTYNFMGEYGVIDLLQNEFTES